MLKLEKAKILEKLIKQSNMSVRAFAEKCGLPESTVYTILKKGAGKANVNNVIAMCRVLGITVEQLDEMSKGISSDDIQINLSDTETEHLHKYRSIDSKGKHTVDTVLEMEYIRCNKPHLVVNAAHAIEGASEEAQKRDNDLMKNDELWGD